MSASSSASAEPGLGGGGGAGTSTLALHARSLSSPPSSSSELAGDSNGKGELFRGFDSFMAFSFTFTTVAVIPSISTAFTLGLADSAPFYLVWVWVMASAFTMCAAASMAEICSGALSKWWWWGLRTVRFIISLRCIPVVLLNTSLIHTLLLVSISEPHVAVYPSAGSVYYWTGNLASPDWAPVMAYYVGFFNLLGNAFSGAALAGGLATLISATVQVCFRVCCVALRSCRVFPCILVFTCAHFTLMLRLRLRLFVCVPACPGRL